MSGFFFFFVDSHCNFKQHISHICRKAYNIMSINVIFRCFHTAHVSALIIAYKSFVRPILEYCSTVWNPYIHNIHYLGLTDQIERVQRYFTRRVYYRCKLDCSHGCLKRLKYLTLESLELRRIYNDLIMVYIILHGLVNINANELIHVKTLPLLSPPEVTVLNFKRRNVSVTLQRINSAIESYSTGTTCLNLLFPLLLQESTSHCTFRSGTDFQPTLLIGIVSASLIFL